MFIIKRIGKKRLIALGVFAAVMAVLLIMNKWIVTTEYRLESPMVENDVTIIQVSDLHNARFGRDQKRLIRAIEKARPDIIAVTGDLIDSNRTDIDTAIEFIERAVEIAPTYYVSGNHEAWVPEGTYKELEERMREAGVTVLNNESVEVTVGETTLTLCGIADPDFSYALAEDDETVTGMEIDSLGLKGEHYTVLLSHRPEVFESYCGRGIDLVMTGHAHGGQVRIPFVGGLVAPDQGFFPEYTEGAHEKDGTVMVISRGLGNSVIPLRVNDCPELVKARITKSGE